MLFIQCRWGRWRGWTTVGGDKHVVSLCWMGEILSVSGFIFGLIVSFYMYAGKIYNIYNIHSLINMNNNNKYRLVDEKSTVSCPSGVLVIPTAFVMTCTEWQQHFILKLQAKDPLCLYIYALLLQLHVHMYFYFQSPSSDLFLEKPL